ncbi:hypothetical protein [Psychroflexus sediminis]|uniref:Uncharacterized protein n=1 Tax=Psychroflexus sediminis TaxID=470826 RepID=A0A1G7X4Z1_9FLAO|nr:hypothetical protein [Psychroflexus sediminis]SDG79225.1 hypothetical protein SAMN04488027_10793 [Psychroflexus sediminis]
MKTLLISFLMLPLLTLNSISSEETSIEALGGNQCSAYVDCDGDGNPEYDMPVDCEFAAELRDQFEDSCQ